MFVYILGRSELNGRKLVLSECSARRFANLPGMNRYRDRRKSPAQSICGMYATMRKSWYGAFV